MAISIGTDMEPFWDEYLLDKDKTTAQIRLNHPVRKEASFIFDAPSDGDSLSYLCPVRTDTGWRMYYNNWNNKMFPSSSRTFRRGIAAIESTDGIHWTRPNYGIVEANGNTDNNLLIIPEMFPECYTDYEIGIDNFFVMRDDHDNPVCPYRYKATSCGYIINPDDSSGSKRRQSVLYGFGSDDGIHFTCLGEITRKGKFDSLNTVHYNTLRNEYVGYIRYLRKPDPDAPVDNYDAYIHDHVRDISVITSPDFIHWSEPLPLDYGDAEEFQLYTNNIVPYYRAPHFLVGTPTRYVERLAWSPNFDRLCGLEERKIHFNFDRRQGTAVTECLFICSRDIRHFKKYDEAFIRPDPENGMNWIYGDMYMSYGIIETPSDVPGADNELSFYSTEGHLMNKPNRLVRYTLRVDGFASLHAGCARTVAVTKPLIFDGNTMLLNFATSARGYVYITVRDASGGNEIKSYEIFGNKADRIVDFDGKLSDLAGRPVIITFVMNDADIYSFRFTNAQKQAGA